MFVSATRRDFRRTSRGSRYSASACLLFIASAGCGEAPTEIHDEARQAVVFGDASGAEDDGVVQLWATLPSSIIKCTASLIAPNLVLTAHHCVAYETDDVYACTPSGELTADSKGGHLGALFDPSSITVRTGATPDGTIAARGTQIFAEQDTSVCRNDLALVVLDSSLTDLPIFPLRLLTGVSPGEKLRLIGYGLDENGRYGFRKSHADLPVIKVGPSQFRPEGDMVAARMFVTLGPAGCSGDSGGPALSAQNAVVGVFSSVVGTCTATTAQGYFNQVAPFYDELLKPAFAAAGAEPTFEAQDPSAAGAAGASASGGDTNNTGGTAGEGAMPDAGETVAGGPAQPSAGAESAPDYHLQRQPGGCKCRFGGGATSGSAAEPALAGLIGLIWFVRTRRRALRRAA